MLEACDWMFQIFILKALTFIVQKNRIKKHTFIDRKTLSKSLKNTSEISFEKKKDWKFKNLRKVWNVSIFSIFQLQKEFIWLFYLSVFWWHFLYEHRYPKDKFDFRNLLLSSQQSSVSVSQEPQLQQCRSVF